MKAKRHVETALKEILNTYSGFDLSRFDYPRQDEWALAWETMQFAARLVEVIRPENIIEFGSGRSTTVLASVAASYGGRILSFEHRKRSARETQAALARSGLSERVCLLRRRLTVRRYGAKFLPIYSVNWRDLESFQPCQMALVDGPPGYIGREATLYELFPRLSVGAWVVADDINRPGERRWLQAWKRAFGEALDIELFPEIGEGAALLRKRAEAAARYPTTPELLKLLWKRLHSPPAPRTQKI